MRSSSLKHYSKKRFTGKTIFFNGSFVIAVIVALSVIVIPCCNFFQNVNAVTEKDIRTVVMAVNELKQQKDKEDAIKKLESEKRKLKKIEKVNNGATETTEPVIETTVAIATEVQEVEAPEEFISTTEASQVVETVEETESITEAQTVAATIEVPKTNNINSDYSPEYISLSAYDRAKLERLVEGEAGGLGYDGCVLVAQAIRDSMNLSNTSSIDKIISDYGYYGSTSKTASKAARDAVSFIFDENGYAVNHRILYFYSSDMVQSEWHETQNYITSCADMRFFDKAV